MNSPVRSLPIYLLIRTFIVLVCLSLPAFAQNSTGNPSQIPQIPTIEQAPDLWYRFFQDGSWHYRVVDGDTVDIHAVSPAYEFRMLYDDRCVVSYTLAEWRRNSQLLRLPRWLDGRIVNAPTRLLSFNSTTEPFLCRSGDTLSFYRELSWRHPFTNIQDTGNYYALDSLDFAIELVRLRDSVRMALIDSLGMLPNLVPGRPRVHAALPIMGLVRYPVPRQFEGEHAFMRLLAYHRGRGPHYFTRLDRITIGLSNSLVDSSCLWYVGMFGEGSPLCKTQVLESMQKHPVTVPYFDVRFKGDLPRRAAIVFEIRQPGTHTLGIYDASGRLLYYPHMAPPTAGRVYAEYEFEQGGTYFIGLLVDNHLIATRKILVVP